MPSGVQVRPVRSHILILRHALLTLSGEAHPAGQRLTTCELLGLLQLNILKHLPFIQLLECLFSVLAAHSQCIRGLLVGMGPLGGQFGLLLLQTLEGRVRLVILG